MKRSLAGCLLALALLLCPMPAIAQRLPTGELNTNRERSYDITHYRADLHFDFQAGSVRGRATVDLEPLTLLSSIDFDAIELEVESVMMRGESLSFDSVGQTLRVSLPSHRQRGDALQLTISYRATPRAGMYFQPHQKTPGLFFVTTYGEGGLHANWLPIYGDVNDRFTTEMAVTVPPPYVVISNGRLVSASATPSGETTYHWHQEKPHPSYLISLYVGDFERGDLEPAFGEIPLSFWVPRGRRAEGAYAFRNTTRMLEYFSNRFDYRYPWHKYDQIAVPDYVVGAMEHTSVTGHNASVLRHPTGSPVDFGGPTFEHYFTDWSAEATISHELAHHWFGNLVTCRNLSYLWLNESFASYLMMLWDEESIGRDQLDLDVDLARRHYLDYVDNEHIIRPLEYRYFDDTNTIYNTEHTYLKGAAVLHMLRGVLGDEDYFEALGYFLQKHAFSQVDSHDLKIAIEESVGRNLEWFWDDWVTGGGHPQLEVSHRFLEDRKQLDLSVRQVQPMIEGQNLFTLPIEVSVVTPTEQRTETLWIEDQEHSFLLDLGEEPLMVSLDPHGYLLAEVDFEKKPDELEYQAAHDKLPGRLRALRRLAERFPTRSETEAALAKALGASRFWAERAEAALLLGSVRTPTAESLASDSLKADDYRVRKAAVIALSRFGTPTANERLAETIDGDGHPDVVGAAIVALARGNPEVPSEKILQQLERESWYDEIRIAALQAIGELDRPELVEQIIPFTEPGWNQGVRQAALTAWAELTPTSHTLRETLLEVAASPAYTLQMYALARLGEHYVVEAVPFLEELQRADVDGNLTVLAGNSLEAIRRVVPTDADEGAH